MSVRGWLCIRVFLSFFSEKYLVFNLCAVSLSRYFWSSYYFGHKSNPLCGLNLEDQLKSALRRRCQILLRFCTNRNWNYQSDYFSKHLIVLCGRKVESGVNFKSSLFCPKCPRVPSKCLQPWTSKTQNVLVDPRPIQLIYIWSTDRQAGQSAQNVHNRRSVLTNDCFPREERQESKILQSALTRSPKWTE